MKFLKIILLLTMMTYVSCSILRSRNYKPIKNKKRKLFYMKIVNAVKAPFEKYVMPQIDNAKSALTKLWNNVTTDPPEGPKKLIHPQLNFLENVVERELAKNKSLEKEIDELNLVLNDDMSDLELKMKFINNAYNKKIDTINGIIDYGNKKMQKEDEEFDEEVEEKLLKEKEKTAQIDNELRELEAEKKKIADSESGAE